MQGRIIKALAGFYYVEHDGVVYQTRARGNFRKKGQTPYVGDFVEFSAEENSEVDLKVAPSDMGKVIGKSGRIAKSIRSVVSAAASKTDKKVIVEIDN